jgi:Outer membrane protein beta-barrel domain
MKKLSRLLAGLCLLAGTANAQLPIPGMGKLPSPIVGIKVGANFNELSTSGSELAQSYTPSFLPGVFAGLHKGKWGARIEAMINFASYKYSLGALGDGTFNNIYLQIPVLIEYKALPRIWVHAGIQFDRTLFVQSAADGNFAALTNPGDYFKLNSYSGIVGAEARLPFHFIVGARYILGFTDIHNASLAGASNAWNTRTGQIYVGFRFL